jgi:hypothetical protein
MNTNLTVSIVSWAGLTSPKNHKDFLAFAKWIDDNHKDCGDSAEQVRLVRTIVGNLKGADPDQLKTMGWFILKDSGRPVCAAWFTSGFQIVTLTTAKTDRKKGHAVLLMKWIRLCFQKQGAWVIAPTRKDILPLMEKAGFTTADDVINPDGTIDVMPEEVKAAYRTTTQCEPKLPLCLENADKQTAFVFDYLPTVASRKAPTIA